MSEELRKDEELPAYNPPEIVELGDALDLTLGNSPGTHIDPGVPPFEANRVLYC